MNPIVLNRLENSFQRPEEALHAAVRDNDFSSLQSYLSSGTFDLEAHDRGWVRYGTALHVAVECNNVTAAYILLRAGAEPLAVQEDGAEGYTPLSLAARLGRTELLRLIWAEVPPEKRVEALEACFLEAATYGRTWVTECLLNCWSTEVETEELVSRGQKIKEAALSRAAAKWQANVVDVLLARVQYRQEVLSDALGRACGYKVMLGTEERGVLYEAFDYTNQQRVIRRLLKTGIDPNSLWHGERLIFRTLYGMGLVGALQVLLQEGADPDIRFSSKRNRRAPLHYLAMPCLIRHIGPETGIHESGVRLLLEYGASVTLPDDSGETPLHVAAYGCDLGLFKFILSKATSEDALTKTNNHGETVLHYAAASKNIEVVQYLLSTNRFDVNQPNTNGWTPIMCSLTTTLESHVGWPRPFPLSLARRATQLLIDHGARTDVATDEGWTPLHCLARNKSAEDDPDARTLAELLVNRGASLHAEASGLSRELRKRRVTIQLSRPWGFRVRVLIEQFPEVLLPPSTPLAWAIENDAKAVKKVLASPLVGTYCYDGDTTV